VFAAQPEEAPLDVEVVLMLAAAPAQLAQVRRGVEVGGAGAAGRSVLLQVLACAHGWVVLRVAGVRPGVAAGAAVLVVDHRAPPSPVGDPIVERRRGVERSIANTNV